jgi:hypothetical protein
MRERNQVLRDAYRGHNGLSMTPEQRADYEAVQKRAREARKIARL